MERGRARSRDGALLCPAQFPGAPEPLVTYDLIGINSYAPYEVLVRRYGLLPEAKPWCYDIAETQHWLGYVPRYSLRQALEELVRYGPTGPPGPVGREAPLPG